MSSFTEVENRIGYTFKNKKLLQKAFTHDSYGYEHKVETYQNMEFLGDSIIDFFVAERLMQLYPKFNQGELTKLRATVVSKDPLADIIDNAGLDNYILLSGGLSASRKTRSDIFESVAAAIYMDSGIDESRKFVLKFLEPLMLGKKIENDYKTKLLELAVKDDFTAEFIETGKSGPDHCPSFSFDVLIDGEICGSGEDHTKKGAMQEAARRALKKMGKI